MLPPIPVPVMRTIEETVKTYEDEAKRAAGTTAPGHDDAHGRGARDDSDDDGRHRRRCASAGARGRGGEREGTESTGELTLDKVRAWTSAPGLQIPIAAA